MELASAGAYGDAPCLPTLNILNGVKQLQNASPAGSCSAANSANNGPHRRANCFNLDPLMSSVLDFIIAILFYLTLKIAQSLQQLLELNLEN